MYVCVMQTEKIFIREDKSRVKVKVTFHVGYLTSEGITWGLSVEYCAPRKRTFNNVHDTDDYTWRRLGNKDRAEYVYQKQLEYVTPEEVLEVKMELWQKLKPIL